MEDRIITLHPGEKAVIYTRPARVLTSVEWDMLNKAEAPLYRAEGALCYTDVNVREESQWIADLWDRVEDAMETQCDFESDSGVQMSVVGRRTKVANRVARVNAVLVFGPEFLIR
jgi:hypothetical protein